ncbi:MAG: DEDD exonuclease domain-containing protein [Bacteroidota bacterium]|nr:DEDD exonuclease domain-containing protein [Bacteroidota bacterium]
MSARPPLFSLYLSDAPYVVCDVETTGLSPERNRIIEIALVRISDGRIVDRWKTLVNPRQFIPPFITEMTGIENDMVYGAPTEEEILPAAARFIGDAVFVAHNARFDRGFLDCAFQRAGLPPLASPSLCTARLARRLVPHLARKSLETVARHLGIRNPRAHRAAGDAETAARVFLHFLRVLEEEHDAQTVGDVHAFQFAPLYRVASVHPPIRNLADRLAELPHRPGVYFFHDRRGDVLYIGKARDLSERVHTYFRPGAVHTQKTLRLVRAVRSISWEETETELSALLLEARSIREHKPPFNTALKNPRAYPFIRIDTADAFPTLSWTYEAEEDGAEYFGPYSSRSAVESALEAVGRSFLLRECEGNIRPNPAHTPCLYHDIKRCGAPCASLMTREEYHREVERVRRFLLGKHDEVFSSLRAAMERKAAEWDFEGAAEIRDRLFALERLVRQQAAMARSLRERNLVIVTVARRTLVEVHCLREGMAAGQAIVDQKRPDRRSLRRLLAQAFRPPQGSLFPCSREEIADMRIIATWCLTRSRESRIVEVDDYADAGSLFMAVLDAVATVGNGGAAEA